MNLASNLRFNARPKMLSSAIVNPTLHEPGIVDIKSPGESSAGTEPWPATLGRGRGTGLSLQSAHSR